MNTLKPSSFLITSRTCLRRKGIKLWPLKELGRFCQFIQALMIRQETAFHKKIWAKAEEFSKIKTSAIAQLDGEAHTALTSLEGVKSTNTFEYRSDFTLDENYKETMITHYKCSPEATAKGNTIAKWTNILELNASLKNPFNIEDKNAENFKFHVSDQKTVQGQAMIYRGDVKVSEIELYKRRSFKSCL